MPADRPPLLLYQSLRELYLYYEATFLCGRSSNSFVSPCDHVITFFDHHFFHLVKLGHPASIKPLRMDREKPAILAADKNFAEYTHDRQRAIYLASALLCIREPDEVWLNGELKSAKWAYLKRFTAKPYSLTVFLIGERLEGLVPITSFPCRARDARKWARGTKIFS